jgi:hypothetical protein
MRSVAVRGRRRRSAAAPARRIGAVLSSLRFKSWAVVAVTVVLGCNSDSGGGNPDAVEAGESADTHDAVDADAEEAAEAPDDAAPTDEAADTETAADAGPDADAEPDAVADADGEDEVEPPPDSGTPCTRDSDCLAGEQWCADGSCVACDNSGLTCDIECEVGTALYERNGCHPCECGRINECATDADCPAVGDAAGHCYAGKHCWGGCDAGDPTCCLGNFCDAAGCGDVSEWTYGCCLFGCSSGYCTPPECTGCDPHCVGGSWEGVGEACGTCMYGPDL